MVVLHLIVYGYEVDISVPAEKLDKYDRELRGRTLGMGSIIEIEDWRIVALHINCWRWAVQSTTQSGPELAH